MGGGSRQANDRVRDLWRKRRECTDGWQWGTDGIRMMKSAGADCPGNAQGGTWYRHKSTGTIAGGVNWPPRQKPVGFIRPPAIAPASLVKSRRKPRPSMTRPEGWTCNGDATPRTSNATCTVPETKICPTAVSSAIRRGSSFSIDVNESICILMQIYDDLPV